MLANLLQFKAQRKFCLMLAVLLCGLAAMYAPPASAAETSITKTIYLNGYQPSENPVADAVAMSIAAGENSATAEGEPFTITLDGFVALQNQSVGNNYKGFFVPSDKAIILSLPEGYSFVEQPSVEVSADNSAVPDSYSVGGTIRVTNDANGAKRISVSGQSTTQGAMIQSITVTYTEPAATPTQYTVNIAAPNSNEGTISVTAGGSTISNGAKVDDGTELTITATPNTGYQLDGITVNGTKLDGNTFTVNGADVTISATFTEIVTETKYTVTIGTIDHGSVTVKDAENNEISTGTEVAAGTSLTITATPDTGYSFEAILVNGTEISGNNITVNENVTITATFTENQVEVTKYNVTIEQPTNGSISVNPEIPSDGQVDENTKLTVTATPAANYRLVELKANETVITSGGEYTVTGNVTFSATFEEDKWQVTVTEPDAAEGTLKVTPAIPADNMVVNGTALTITATAKSGYELEGIYVNGVKNEGNTYTINGADVTIEAKFTKIVLTPTVPGAPEGSLATEQGTVVVTGTIALGETITITVTPKAGWEVTGVKVNGTAATLVKEASPTALTEATPGEAKSYNFTITQTVINSGKLEIEPSYTAQTFTLTKTQSDNGGTYTVTNAAGTSLADNATITYDEVLTIIPSPNQGYKVGEVTANGTALERKQGANEYEVTVKGDVEIAVTFITDNAPVSLDILAPQNGTITVTDAAGQELIYGNKVNYGDEITITATPAEDYKLVKITVTPNSGAAEELTESPATYTVPDGGISALAISATFSPIKNCSINWTAPAAADGTMTVKTEDGTPILNADKVAQDTKIIVTCVAAKENFAPTLTLNGTALTPTTTQEQTYTYNITITGVTNNLAVSFADTREEVNIVAQTQTGGTVTFYSDEARKTRLTPKNTDSVDGYSQQYYTLRNTQLVYATIAASGKVPTVKIGTKGNQKEEPVTDNQFVFPASQGLIVTTTFATAPTEYSFKYSIAKGSENMGSITVAAGGQSIATDQTVKLVKGTAVEVSIVPVSGYRIKSVTGVPTGVTYTEGSATSPTTRTFNFSISSNVTISATFEQIPTGSVTWTFNGLKPDATEALAKLNGTFNMTIGGDAVPNDNKYTEDVEATYTVTANDQYYITKLTINGQTPSDFDSQLRPSTYETTTGIKAFTRSGSGANVTYTSTNVVAATFAHHKVTVKYTVNSDAVVATGMVKAYTRTTTTSSTGVVTNKDTQILNGSQVDSGTALVFKATPTTGYKVTSMTVNGEIGSFESDSKGNPTNVYAVEVTAPDYDTEADNVAEYKIVLELELLPVAITITGNTGTTAHGTIEVTNQDDNTAVVNKDEVKVGSKLRVIVMAASGYQIKDIKINGTTQELPTPNAVNATLTDIEVTGPMTIAVTWEKQKFQVSIDVTAGATYGAEGAPTIGTTGKQEASYESGASVTLNANPAVGYEVTGWYLNGVQVTRTVGTGVNQREEPVTTPTLAVKVTDRPQSYLVAYAIKEYAQHNVFWAANTSDWNEPDEDNPVWGTITMLYPNPADLTSSPAGRADDAQMVKDGILFWNYVVKVKAEPTPEPAGKYYFENWTVKTSGSSSSYTTSDLKSPILSYAGNSTATLTANFGRSWTVKSTVDDATLVGGTFTINLLGTDEPIDPIIGMEPTYVHNKGQVKLTAEPDPNYRVACFVINGMEQSAGNSATTVTRTLTITEDTSIGVVFYNPSGIEDVTVEEATEGAEEWFTIQGRYLGTEKPTATGIYLRRVDGVTTKIMIR